MPTRAPITRLPTHEVTNQPPPLDDFDAYGSDRALSEAVAASEARDLAPRLAAFGQRVGSAEVRDWARQANRHPPEFRPFDRYGQRIDEVEFHPAYHALMEVGLSAGISALPWSGTRGGHTAHAAMMYLMGHADSGVCCPMSMTYAAMPVLRHDEALAAQWAPRVLASVYDPRSIPAHEKRGVTLGMAMTEKQGGSDVRANTTRAEPVDGGAAFELTGHKWFCSAPMCDAFLTLAQTGDGLTCFFVPRWRPDGTRNTLRIARLKDKLGDRSNASSEIEYERTWALRVGEPGRGIATIIEMVQGTRLDCLAGSAGIMRAALSEALWHARHRHAFGKPLIEQPLMAQVLADLCIEAEAATALAMRVGTAFDRAAADESEAAFARLVTPVAKYWLCKRTPGFVYEAMECLGGAGYVEESALPRLYRQAPLNSIWEGSGNVIALDVLRALAREPQAAEALVAALDRGRGADAGLDRYLDAVTDDVRRGADPASARRLVERLALAVQGATLAEAGAAVLPAFGRARLGPTAQATYGAGPVCADGVALFERAMPAAAS